jgi:hypothetical protein
MIQTPQQQPLTDTDLFDVGLPQQKENLSPNQLRHGLEKSSAAGSDFATSLLASLIRYKNLTPKQLPWAQKLAWEALTGRSDKPKAKGMDLGGEMTGLVAKFREAKESGLKCPMLLFKFVGNCSKLRVSLAPDTGKNPGCLYVKADGNYAGKITPQGEFFGSRDCNEAVRDFLKEFAVDPVGVGARKGREAGICCYCASELTDARSLTAGYGPVCAKSWKLPWGGK